MKYRLTIIETPYTDAIDETHDDYLRAFASLLTHLNEIIDVDIRDEWHNVNDFDKSFRFTSTMHEPVLRVTMIEHADEFNPSDITTELAHMRPA